MAALQLSVCLGDIQEWRGALEAAQAAVDLSSYLNLEQQHRAFINIAGIEAHAGNIQEAMHYSTHLMHMQATYEKHE